MARKIYGTLTLHAVLPGGTSAADLITNYVPGFAGTIEGWSFVGDVAATGSSASRTFNLEINTTDVTSTATAVVLADLDTSAGKVKALTAPTALNTFGATDSISVEVANGGTAFTAGAVNIVITYSVSARGI